MNTLFGGLCRECDNNQAVVDLLRAEIERYKLEEAQRLTLLGIDAEATDRYRELKALRTQRGGVQMGDATKPHRSLLRLPVSSSRKSLPRSYGGRGMSTMQKK